MQDSSFLKETEQYTGSLHFDPYKESALAEVMTFCKQPSSASVWEYISSLIHVNFQGEIFLIVIISPPEIFWVNRDNFFP